MFYFMGIIFFSIRTKIPTVRPKILAKLFPVFYF